MKNHQNREVQPGRIASRRWMPRALAFSWLLGIAPGCRHETESTSAAVEATDPPVVSDASVRRAVAREAGTVVSAENSVLSPDGEVPSAPTVVPTGDVDPTASWSGFLGGQDDTLLRLVCNTSVEKIERNRGGSTISFRVWFTNGGRGLFKPQQSNSVANFRAELGAFRLGRVLGIHRTPPACGRSIERSRLQQAADASGDAAFSERVMKEILARSDNVPGAMLYWVPGPLENVPIPTDWKQQLEGSIPLSSDAAQRAVVGDLARLVIFDFLIDNVDRWSGGNILRQHLRGQEPTPMLFMDNGASFTIGPDGLGARPREQAARLAGIHRFPARLIARLRELTAEDIQKESADDPLGAPLGEGQIKAILARRDKVIAQVDADRTRTSDAATLALP